MQYFIYLLISYFVLVLKNSICKFLLTAFIHERIAGTWPDAISSLLNILKDSLLGREIFLKFCLILTEEIANCNANLVKNEVLSKRNADLRDSMRNGEVALLCKFWRQILQQEQQLVNKDSNEDKFADDQKRLTVLALECLAAFSSWIDVGLVVEQDNLNVIYFLLQSNTSQIQLTAADCLAEIVLKGMPAGDKISLASYMNLVSVFEAVGSRGVIDPFFGKICRILNNLGYSLGQQISLAVPSAVAEVQAQVVQYIGPILLPHLLQFLRLLARQPRGNRIANECWLESLSSQLPFIGNFFEIARSMRDSLRPDQNEFMGQFLPVCCDLLQLADCEAAAVEDNSDEEFDGIRVSLFQAFDSVLWLQGHATIAFLNELCRSEPLTVGRCELLVRLVLRLPEGMRGAPTFTISINGNNRMTPVSELVTWVNEIVPERFPQLLYLVSEVLARYSSTAYLDVFSDRIDECLRSLMRLAEMRGFKEVDCEKLLKFVKNLKGKLGEYAVMLLTALQGPFNNTQLPVMSTALYEVAGFAVASLDGRTVQMDVITPEILKSALDASMNPISRVNSVNCLAAFAKGFMADSCLDPLAVKTWFNEYCSRFLYNRISRGSFEYLSVLIIFAQRMIPLLQADSILLICELSENVLLFDGEGKVEILSQLLPLLSAALFKLRDQFANQNVLGSLWPKLIARIYSLLCLPINGTDDFLNNLSLSKASVSLLHALSTSPSASSCTLAQPNPLIELILMKIAEGVDDGTNNSDFVGLIRSLCGVVSKCQGFLAHDFISYRFIPCMLTKSIPAIFKSLDPSCKKSPDSIPASVLNLLQDFVKMIRSMPWAIENNSWFSVNGFEIINGDINAVRRDLVYYFINLE